jgi:hypothetical protein
MLIRVGVENGNDNRSLAWALDHPGCFVYGKDESEAILNLPLVFLHYAEWIAGHTNQPWLTTEMLEIKLVEVWQCYFIDSDLQTSDDGIEVNAWFREDWRPLSETDVERGIQLLNWSREDLLLLIRSLTPAQLSLYRLGFERWTIDKILQHIANAEWWYLDRLELAPWSKSVLPSDSIERLAFVRARVMQVMWELPDLKKVIGKEGEFWSSRKLLRRLLYHERDHLDHIRQLLAEPY